MAATLSSAVQAVSHLPFVYRLQQRIARPTTSRFRALLLHHVQVDAGQRVLDVACGIGNYRDMLRGQYHGCDINPAYIDMARKKHTGNFEVMDCCDLAYADDSFDHVVTIAATHHLDDGQLDAMIGGALRVCKPGGSLHVLDAVLPVAGNKPFKRFWFGLDAGRFPRTPEQLQRCLARHGQIVQQELVPGPLHDCAYFQVQPRGARH